MFTLSFNFLALGLVCLVIALIMSVAQIIDSDIIKVIFLLIFIGIAIIINMIL